MHRPTRVSEPVRRGEFAALAIGPHVVDPPVVLAPMAGVTSPPFRRLCRDFGAGLFVSEMITARGYVEGSSRTRRMAAFADDESPRSIQLYGTDPTSMGEAVRRLVSADRVDHIDMNFGCPARKVTRHGGGAAVPVKRRLFAELVRAAVAAAGPVPVTVKFRIGIDDDLVTYLDAGRIAEAEGAAAVALHARTAHQLYSGEADWSAIARLKETVTSIPVLGNGDVWEADDAVRMMRRTGCDGVVVGRGCLGRPWLFRDLVDVFSGGAATPPPPLGHVGETMLRHADLHAAWFEGDLREFRKHTAWYLKGYPVGGPLRHAFGVVRTVDELALLVGRLDPAGELPTEAIRAPRGHTGGPRRVALPDGWSDDRDGLASAAAGDILVSGG